MCGWGYTLATVVLNGWVQAGDVQSRSVLDSHCSRKEEIEVGEVSDGKNAICLWRGRLPGRCRILEDGLQLT